MSVEIGSIAKIILNIILTFVLMGGCSYAYCTQEPSTNAPKQNAKNGNGNTKQSAPIKPNSMPQALYKDTKNECANCDTFHENGWENVLNNPVAIFTFFIAIFTLMLYVDGAAANKRRLRAYVMPESVGIYEGTMMEPPQPERTNVPGIAMIIKNSGQTPAFKVVSWADIAVIGPINEHIHSEKGNDAT